MLVKVKNGSYFTDYEELYTKSGSWTFSGRSSQTLVNNQTINSKYIMIDMSINNQTSRPNPAVDSNYAHMGTSGADYYSGSTDFPFVTEITPGTAHTVTIRNAGSSSMSCNFDYFNCFAYSFELVFTKEYIINGIPTSLKLLGDLGAINIFGNNNGDWNFGPSEHEESSTATTGSITPGNYVKYLTIRGADGELYKVGVYK